MSRFLSYSPEQAYLIPPDVKQVLGAKHLCFFEHEMVERLDLRRFEEAYGDEGGVLYHSSLMLKVWLYAYTLGLISSRLEQRAREDLALRYLAGGAQPVPWSTFTPPVWSSFTPPLTKLPVWTRHAFQMPSIRPLSVVFDRLRSDYSGRSRSRRRYAGRLVLAQHSAQIGPDLRPRGRRHSGIRMEHRT
jgi:hypothetical protein